MEENELICQHIAYFGVRMKKYKENCYGYGVGQICTVLDELFVPVSESPVEPKKYGGRNHTIMFHQGSGGITRTIAVTHDHEAYAFEGFRFKRKLGRIDKFYELYPTLGKLKAVLFVQDRSGEWIDNEITLAERATTYLQEREREKLVKQILKGS